MTSTAAPRGRRAPERLRRRAVALALVPVVLVLLAEPLARLMGLAGAVPTAVVGVTEAIVPGVAAALAARRSRRERGAQRTGWTLMAAACASWCAGQVVFAGYEVVLGQEVPEVSAADAGFLGFSVLAPAAVLLLSHGALRAASRVRGVLDGLIVSGALGVLAWVLLIRHIVHGGTGLLPVLVTSAYPVGDVVVLSVTITVLARARASSSLQALTLGAALMAASDSVFVYLRADGAFETGGLLDALWTGAFATMAVAAVLSGRPRSRTTHVRTSVLVNLLPYVPFGVASLAVLQASAQQPLGPALLASVAALVGLVLLRQALVVVDNVALTRELQERSATLGRLAYTDQLTGAANRAAFVRALGEALDEESPVVTAFCDLDSFKAVNDLCGHATGDELLVAVAARLRQVVRPHDVVARLGGDEFAVLVIDDDGEPRSPDQAAAELRERLETALSVPYSLDPRLVERAATAEVGRVLDAVSASIGAVSSAELGAPTSEELLHAADERMYVVKRGRREGRRSLR